MTQEEHEEDEEGHLKGEVDGRHAADDNEGKGSTRGPPSEVLGGASEDSHHWDHPKYMTNEATEAAEGRRAVTQMTQREKKSPVSANQFLLQPMHVTTRCAAWRGDGAGTSGRSMGGYQGSWKHEE